MKNLIQRPKLAWAKPKNTENLKNPLSKKLISKLFAYKQDKNF